LPDLPILDISQSRDFSVNIRRRADLKSPAGGMLLTFGDRGIRDRELIGDVGKWICLRQIKIAKRFRLFGGRKTEQ
jgi:hypothetical protein